MVYLKPKENSEELLLRLFDSIFDKINGLRSKRSSNYTFYTHNMGRFDGLFILKSIIQNPNYNVKPFFKDNTLMKIQIKNNISKNYITILDSYLLLPSSLRNLLVAYKCDLLKGTLPYRFINKDNLYYIGSKPPKEFYDISNKDYKLIPLKDWNLQEEVLKYLNVDVKGLLKVLKLSNEQFFNKTNMNITKYLTLPSYSLAVYSANYYDESNHIKVIKGLPEKNIREAYFGGNAGVYLSDKMKGKIHNNLYIYDMNSQYPNAMLKDMPVGNPVFTTTTNLSSFFGFAYGTITPPTTDKLRVAYIQYRNEDGSVTIPREKFKRWIFSEEMKYGIKDGYTFDMEYG